MTFVTVLYEKQANCLLPQRRGQQFPLKCQFSYARPLVNPEHHWIVRLSRMETGATGQLQWWIWNV